MIIPYLLDNINRAQFISLIGCFHKLVPIATGAVPAHVVNQDEQYVGPVGSLCLPLGRNPGGMNPDQARKNQQRKEWLHLATFAGTRGIR